MAKNNNRLIKSENFRHYLLSGLILFGACVALAAMSLARKPPDTSDDKNLLQTVSVFEAADFDGQLEIKVSGMVEPHREIEIAAQVSGEVLDKEAVCRAGNFVEAGTDLIKIDSTNYDLAYNRLEAEKTQAEANIVELDQELANLDSSLELAQKEFDLQKAEYKRKELAGSALSASELDQALRALTSAERSLTELRNTRRLTETRRTRLQSGIELSNVKLKEAQLNKDRCEIKAPFAGVIVSDPVEQGDYVSTGNTLIVIEDTDKTDVKCNLRFEQLLKIVKYQVPDSRFVLEPAMAYQMPPTPVKVQRDRGDGTIVSWDGTLIRYDGIGVDPTTKMIPCRIVVEDPISMENGRPKALVRGMFVGVTIPLDVVVEEGKSMLTFPIIAIRPGNYVWSVMDGKLKRHKVEILDRKNQDDPDPRKRMVVVKVDSSELAAGAKIVTTPLAQPNPGTEVSIVEQQVAEATAVEKTNGDPAEPDSSLPTSTSTSTDDLEPGNARKDQGTIRS